MMTQCPNCQKEIPVSSRHWGKWGCDSCRPPKKMSILVILISLLLIFGFSTPFCISLTP